MEERLEVHDVDNVRPACSNLKEGTDHHLRIPVYPINAAYMGPLTLYLYFKYGRATDLGWKLQSPKSDTKKHHADQSPNDKDIEDQKLEGPRMLHEHMHHQTATQHSQQHESVVTSGDHDHSQHMDHHQASAQTQLNMPHIGHSMSRMDSNRMRMDDPNRPFWATVLIGVSHCGAGCVLGDLVGEWLVYGTNVMINGQNMWPELLIDYGFALLFGIVFQYFSIAPMSGQYGPKTLVRAAKADILSLTAFELGLFGWMVAYQVGIWNYELEMNTWTYWWMMQVGMVLGFITSAPINWYLLKYGIKEPCV